MPLDRAVEAEAAVARPELGLGVERMQREDVAVGLPGRRARPAVARRAEVVPTLGRCRLPLAERAGDRWQPPRQPVRERVPPGVGIVEAERERDGTSWERRPLERRRDVVALAGVPRRDRLAVAERGARQLHRRARRVCAYSVSGSPSRLRALRQNNSPPRSAATPAAIAGLLGLPSSTAGT